LQGSLNGKTFLLGSSSFLSHNNVQLPEERKDDSDSLSTTVYFAQEHLCLTILSLGDQLKSGVKEFIEQLSPIKPLLVSGDGERAVRNVAEACRINEWHSGFHPLQKRALIEKLREKGEIVAMIGDGINDAPALTASHIGIAVVTASDISIQVSDLLMTTGNFEALKTLRQSALKGRKIVKQNLFWAFFYNCFGLGLAAAGWLTPLFAACAMVASSLIVLLNAQRISLYSSSMSSKNGHTG
jgi:P-type Cu2+ transporter